MRIAEAHEKFWGRRGDAHLCVTQAMKTELRHNWGIVATVFHDKAPSSFRACTLQEKHNLFSRLNAVFTEPMHPNDCISHYATACLGTKKVRDLDVSP